MMVSQKNVLSWTVGHKIIWNLYEFPKERWTFNILKKNKQGTAKVGLLRKAQNTSSSRKRGAWYFDCLGHNKDNYKNPSFSRQYSCSKYFSG